MCIRDRFDNFGYNLFRGNVSGPLLKRKFEGGEEKSIIGFRLSGQYRRQTDDDPPALPVFRVKDEVLAELEANPLSNSLIGGLDAIVPTAQTFGNDEVDVLDFRPNEEVERIDFTAKIDARLTDQIDVTFSGTYNKQEDRFTPGFGSTAQGGTWTTFNSHNNPLDDDERFRGNFRFRHRLGNTAVSDDSDAAPSIIQNASYTLQLGYERQFRETADSRHGDNFFDYGHIGEFDVVWNPAYGQSDYSGAIQSPNPPFNTIGHIDYRRDFVGYTPGTTNPVLANYNNVIEDAVSDFTFPAQNGQFIGSATSIWNFHTNVG